MCYPEGTLTVQRFYNSHKSHIILLDGIVTRTTLFFLVYRTFGGQGVCLAGRCVHKYHKQPVGSGHYARQLRLKPQDRRNLSLGKKRRQNISFHFGQTKQENIFRKYLQTQHQLRPSHIACTRCSGYCLRNGQGKQVTLRS